MDYIFEAFTNGLFMGLAIGFIISAAIAFLI